MAVIGHSSQGMESWLKDVLQDLQDSNVDPYDRKQQCLKLLNISQKFLQKMYLFGFDPELDSKRAKQIKQMFEDISTFAQNTTKTTNKHERAINWSLAKNRLGKDSFISRYKLQTNFLNRYCTYLAMLLKITSLIYTRYVLYRKRADFQVQLNKRTQSSKRLK